jgi:hypothetical protein
MRKVIKASYQNLSIDLGVAEQLLKVQDTSSLLMKNA